MANLSKSLTALGQGLSQVGSTIQNYHDKKQEAEYLAVRKEQAGVALEEAKLGQAVNRVKMGMQLETPALRKKYFEGTGKNYLNTMFGDEVAPEVVDYLATPVGTQKARIIFELSNTDIDSAKKELNKMVSSGAIKDPAVANQVFNEIIENRQKQANLRKTEAESTSAFGDPKFAFKQYSDEATFKIKDANDRLANYRKTLGVLQDANKNAPFQQIQRQALQDAGINGVEEFQTLQGLARLTPTQYAGAQMKSKGMAFQGASSLPAIPTQSAEPRQTVRPIGETEADTQEGGQAPRLSSTPPKQMSEAEVTKLADARLLPELFNTLDKELDKKKSLFGPIKGRIGQANVYNVEAQTFDGKIRTISQQFGRFMEGGVLRKEDEIKYRQMFPNLADVPEVAKKKLENIRQIFNLRNQLNEKMLQNSGFNVPASGRGDAAGAELDNSDDAALKWARENPEDPRSKQILSTLGVK